MRKNLLAIAMKTYADVILIDRKLPGYAAGDLIVQLHALTPRPMVIVMDSLPEASRMALREGADVVCEQRGRSRVAVGILAQVCESDLIARPFK